MIVKGGADFIARLMRWHPCRPCKHQRRHFPAPSKSITDKETHLIDAVAWQTAERELQYRKEKEAKLQERKKKRELSPTAVIKRLFGADKGFGF
jgi:hypothetical protein